MCVCVCVCVVSGVVKRPVLPPCEVDGRSRNPLSSSSSSYDTSLLQHSIAVCRIGLQLVYLVIEERAPFSFLKVLFEINESFAPLLCFSLSRSNGGHSLSVGVVWNTSCGLLIG